MALSIRVDGHVIPTMGITSPLQVFAGGSDEKVPSFLSSFSCNEGICLELLATILHTTQRTLNEE